MLPGGGLRGGGYEPGNTPSDAFDNFCSLLDGLGGFWCFLEVLCRFRNVFYVLECFFDSFSCF